MRAVTIIVALTLCPLLTACSKEDGPAPTTTSKPAAIQVAEQVAASADMSTARKTYEIYCSSCHATGVMHAPKLGDKKAWASHIEQGLERMVSNAIGGIGKMPPKGGHINLSDADVREAVKYMVEQSR